MQQFQSASTTHSVAVFRLIDRALRRALPALGDFALVHVRTRGTIAGVAAAHHRGEKTRVVRALMRVHRPRLSDADSTVASVMRTGRPLLRVDIQPEAGRHGGRVIELHQQLAPRSALVVPIEVRGTIVGALSLCYSDSGRRYGPADVPAARRLALRIGYVLLMATEPNGFTLPRQSGTPLRRRVTAGP